MLALVNSLLDSYNIPVLTAFLLGVLTSISPCPLATNITAIAFISREIKPWKHTLLNALYYVIGRGIGYTALAMLIYFGLSSFQVARIFQSWGDKVLGPILIIIGLVMLNVIKIDLGGKGERMEKLKTWLAGKGYLGSLSLGIVFSLAFCPYSGVLFFGALMPLTLAAKEGLLLPPVFALGTGLPVIIFAILIATSMEAVGRAFRAVQKIEKLLRFGVAAIFILAGLYYSQYLVKYLINFI